MGSDAEEPEPPRPRSPFVSNLRMQVAMSRQQGQLEHTPSVATWLSPRSPRQGVSDGPSDAPRASVSFAETNEVVPISSRKIERVMLTINFKGTCAKPFKLENIDDRLTVRNVKELCGPKTSLPPEQMRLLYKGVILQDSQLLRETNIADKATLFLVKGAVASNEPKEEASSSSGARSPCDEFDDMFEERGHMVAILCIECGVNPGRLLTDGLCSICFRELVMKENAAMKKRKEEAKIRDQEARLLEEAKRKEEEELEARRQKNTTRCYKCGKKTGLTGFECKCGYIFCAAHRHAEDHACAFDHKAHGRQILAQQNPKVQNSTWD